MGDVSFYEVTATSGPEEVDGKRVFKYKNGVFIAGEFNGGKIPAKINVLPKPGRYKHAIYGTVIVTSEKNQEFADNFNNEVYQKLIPIDFEHDLVLSGACAYYEPGTAEVLSDGSVDIGVRWEDRGKQAINEGRFYYFSPALLDKWVEPLSKKVHNNVLIGGALTTSPYFKDAHLRPLYASELKSMGELSVSDVHLDRSMKTCPDCKSEYSESEFAENSTSCKTCSAKPFPAKKTTPDPDAADDAAEAKSKTMNARKERNMDEVVDPKAFSAMQEQLAALLAQNKASEAEAKSFKEQLDVAHGKIAKEEVSRRHRLFNDIVAGRDLKGDGAKVFRGDSQVHAKVLDAIYMFEGEEAFAEESLFSQYVAQQRSLAAAFSESDKLTRAIGGRGSDAADGGSGDPQEAAAAAVAKYMSENKGVNSADAYREVAKADPKLFSRVRKSAYDKRSIEDNDD